MRFPNSAGHENVFHHVIHKKMGSREAAQKEIFASASSFGS
jgi:hypothetical protein